MSYDLTNFETIITAQLFLKIFQSTAPLSKYLQTSGMWILQAKSMINTTLKTLKSEFRNFENIYEVALKFVSWANKNLEEQNIDLDVQESFFDPVEKFKINVFYITMDNVINNIEYRFKNENDLTADFSYLDPKYFKQISFLPESAFEKLCNSLNSFKNGPNIINIKTTDLREELLDFKKKWPKLRYSLNDEIKNLHKTQIENYMEESNGEEEEEEENNFGNDQPCNDQKNKRCFNCILCCFNILVQYNLYSNAYYNLFIAYKYVLSLSSTQVACERSFSTLNLINDRLCYLTITGKIFDIVLINCYAPTKIADEDLKDAFYETLERTFNCISANSKKIVLGDMNAQVGRERIFKKTADKTKTRPRLDTNKFKDPEIIKTYQNTISNLLYNNSSGSNQNPKDEWKEVKDAVNKAAEIFQNSSQNNKNPTNKTIRKEKREVEKKFMKSIEEYSFNPRSFFKKCKSIKNGFKTQITMIKDDKGHLLTDETSIANRFKTHFYYSLLNVTKELNEDNVNYPIYYTVQPEILALNFEEIKINIKMLKNNKAPGEDNINAELIKISTPEIL
ncbi:hypothetical protein QTP88_009923 [Uroleucon formosanum]